MENNDVSGVNKPFKGLHTDNNPQEQPKDTYRYALNTVNETSEGLQSSLTNEGSNYLCSSIPFGYNIIGDKYLEDDTTVLFLTNSNNSRQEIGLLKKDSKYETVVNTEILNFNIKNQIDATYRLRRGDEKVIYWVDGLNKARSFNLNRVHNYHTQAYNNYLQSGGDPNTYPGEKWDANSFELLKSYDSIPWISNVEVLDYGNTAPGSYNFAIQYIDEDLNPTEWINTSNTVNIYNSSKNLSYENIRGSYNTHQFQQFPEASKSIKITLSNLDKSYPYYRVGIIQASSGTGQVTKAFVSPPQSSNVGVYIYSGNEGSFEEIDVNEIRFEKEHILKPKHIEQLENRLILANTEGLDYNWCEFQKYASKIGANLTTEEVIVNNIKSQGNLKNENSSFSLKGYMPGEVYSFGIVYIMKDNSLSPVFHIPGKSPSDTTSTMAVYEGDSFYPDIHKCKDNNYWGRDIMNNSLLGERVRHHKFPTRQETGIPLITSIGDTKEYYKHKLSMRITLNPNETYPEDNNNNPLIIDYSAVYQIIGQPVAEQAGFLSKSQLGVMIDVLEVTLPVPGGIQMLYPPDYFRLSPTCELMTVYQISGSEKFKIEYFYTPIEEDSIYDTVNSNIFGIEFNNIEKPHPDVIGFYVVKNEILDQDKLIIDNAIVGPNVVEREYKAFTHLTPAYPIWKLDNKSVWIFSPEVNFNKKFLNFNDLNVQGHFHTNYIHTPTLSEDNFFKSDSKKSTFFDPMLGVYIEDVQSGTSYNAEVHKKRDKDSDGFALQICFKTSMFNYSHQAFTLGKVSNVFVLSAAENKIESGNVYYNVSTDNKITMVELSNPFDNSIFKTGTDFNILSNGLTVKGSRLLYASLRRGHYEGSTWVDMKTSYQDFITRPYYKEHMNPMLFGNSQILNGFRVFNGDVYVSSFNFLTSMFRRLYIKSRRSKTSLWRYIVGAVLIVVGVILLAAGGSGAAVIAGGTAVMAAGAYFIDSGIKLDKVISMFNEDYEKGLLDCIEDEYVVKTMGSPTKDGIDAPGYKDFGDDVIQWFVDRAANLYIESRVPVGLRSGATSGDITDFMDAPAPYSESVMNNYLTEKLTFFDRNRGGGRLYRGIANAEVYSVNPDYSRINREKSYIHLPSSWDCCNEEDIKDTYPTRVWYSQQSFQEEKIDNYRAFLINNYRDIEGENGEITDLYKMGNSLFIHTKEALWQLPQNLQEKVGNELTTYIGTGEFFSVPPRKILDDNLGSGGSKHKWGTLKTKFGVLFISEVEDKVYLHSEGLKDISLTGMRNWFENNLKFFLSQQVYELVNKNYHLENNPANPTGIGFISCYDTRYERVLITKRDWSILGNIEIINASEEDRSPVIGQPYITTIAALNEYNGEFWRVDVYEGDITRNRGPIGRFEDFPETFENKSFTISYSFHTGTWISFHSYIPNYYIHNQNNFYSFITGSVLYAGGIWKHNKKEHFQTFYEIFYPHIIEYISNVNPLVTKIQEDITFLTEASSWDATNKYFKDEGHITHNKIILSNSRQCSGELTMKVKEEEEDYLFEQINNTPGEIIINRDEKDWNVNQLRDFVIDYNIPFFSRDWDVIKNSYPIDKVINPLAIDFNKDWNQIESFRDKYISIRLKFDTHNNVRLTTQYSFETILKS